MFIKKYLCALSIVLAIDLTWVLLIMRSFYNQQLAGFARPESMPIWSAALAWALIPFGLVLFVLPLAKTPLSSLVYGALYGFILYGVYDFTNYATLAHWTIPMLVVDILWGATLCGISSALITIATEYFGL